MDCSQSFPYLIAAAVVAADFELLPELLVVAAVAIEPFSVAVAEGHRDVFDLAVDLVGATSTVIGWPTNLCLMVDRHLLRSNL